MSNDTPRERRHHNRPGQPRLQYRLDTQPGFLGRMLAELPRQTIPDGPNAGARPLRALTTRDAGDPAIALLDAWACAADVLTFYQERIADEGFLRTATEPRSVHELARAIGHEPSPGVSASTHLAFTVDDSARAATVPAGTRVQSVPGQGERPQTFETDKQLEACAAWNQLALAPPQPARQTLAADRPLSLAGTDARLRPGDRLLVTGDERAADPASDRWALLTVHEVHIDREAGQTRVIWQGDTSALPAVQRVHVLRRQAPIFGYNAAVWATLPDTNKHGYASPPFGTDWPGFALEPDSVELDGAHPDLLEGSWLVLCADGGGTARRELRRAVQVTSTSRSAFGLTGKITRVVLDAPLPQGQLTRRGTTVYVHSEPLALAPVVERAPIGGAALELVRSDPAPRPGQLLLVAASKDYATALPGEIAIVARVEDVPHPDHVSDPARMRVVLEQPLQNLYDPDQVVLYGNVARATHGETVEEILGSGDASRRNQRFALSGIPLTYLPAANPRGVASTLEVRVHGVLWREVASLLEAGARSRVYIVRQDETSRTEIVFGDGVRGARLPSGQENVVARYRVGTGRAGNVPAGSLLLIPSRPLGVRAVTNPLPAVGGAEPDTLAQARDSATATVLVMDRLVAAQDYEDFARAYAGIDKAAATMLVGARGRLVHLTVAAAGGDPVPEASALHQGLRAAIDALSDHRDRVQIDSYAPLGFRIVARLRVHVDHSFARVALDAVAALRAAFAFDSRTFGQSVAASEVIGVIQSVPGVEAVDMDALYREIDAPSGSPPDPAGQPSALLEALPARYEWVTGPVGRPERVVRPAQLLFLSRDDQVQLTEVTA
jgi:predicted phage baseplate assembly protein